MAAATGDLRNPRPLVPEVLHHARLRVPALVAVSKLPARPGRDAKKDEVKKQSTSAS